MTISFADVERAARLLDGAVLRTPLLPSEEISRLCGCQILLKLENLQVSGSFKARGALVRMLALDPARRRAGVVAMSAGNHAQGVAYHANRLGIPAVIVMPKATPLTKIERTRRLGASVVLEGETLGEAEKVAHDLASKSGFTFIHPYDDADVIAGQGTVAIEMLEGDAGFDCLVVPVGGGGLIAGMAVAAKSMNPAIEIIGVQCDSYPSMLLALRGKAAECRGYTIAEGIAVKALGRLTVPIVKRHVADILTVGETALERAVQTLMEAGKVVAEGAGAAALAAVLAHPRRFRGKRVGVVVSGGNVDARLLASILMRSLCYAGRLARLRIQVSDVPGMLARAATIIGDAGGNIIEIYHQRLFADVPVKFADVDVVVETTSLTHVTHIVESLRTAGLPTRVLSSSADGD